MITITENDAFLLVLAMHYQWTKRSLYSEYNRIISNLSSAGPIEVHVYYPDGTYEVKNFNSVSELLDWKQSITSYSVAIINGKVTVTIRKES